MLFPVDRVPLDAGRKGGAAEVLPILGVVLHLCAYKLPERGVSAAQIVAQAPGASVLLVVLFVPLAECIGEIAGERGREATRVRAAHSPLRP
eukprot:2750714-Prymnesium_polylepis.2